MASRFLFNQDLWIELGNRLAKAKTARVAVAYFGTGASRLLPLRRGHQIVVDMSLRSVRAGTTDPREVRKLFRRGVQVFSRESLHAKFFIFDRVVIAGSSNISNHAQGVLDEAAVVTDDHAAVARAGSTFDRLCTEPVRGEYLRRCIKEYRPPRFVTGQRRPSNRTRAVQAKLWIVGGLVYRGLPESEESKAERVARRAERKVADHDRFDVEYINYPRAQRFFRQLRDGDWVIHCIRDGSGFDVYPPSRFLGVDSYPRARGKSRYLLLLEQPLHPRTIRWQELRRSVAGSLPAVARARPRTLPVADNEDADALLRLWDANGRFRKGRR